MLKKKLFTGRGSSSSCVSSVGVAFFGFFAGGDLSALAFFAGGDFLGSGAGSGSGSGAGSSDGPCDA